MDSRKKAFLNEVLGESGANALAKAAERSEAFEQVLVPRAILAWVQAASMYEGAIPGTDGILLFAKSSSGFSGSVEISGDLYKFDDVSIFQLVSAVSIAIGDTANQEEEMISLDELRSVDVERLGKSIDILAKARRVQQELAKKDKFCPGCTFKREDRHAKDCEKKPQELEKALRSAPLPKDCNWCEKKGVPATHYDATPDTYKPRLGEAHHPADTACDAHKSNLKTPQPVTKTELNKAKEGPGMTAAPLAPTAPSPPTSTAPQPTATKVPSLPGSAQQAKAAKSPKVTTKITKSEASGACRSCGQHQFGNDMFVFRGCTCFRAIASGVSVQALGKSEVILEMDTRIWGPEAIVTFLESVGRIRDAG